MLPNLDKRKSESSAIGIVTPSFDLIGIINRIRPIKDGRINLNNSLNEYFLFL